MSRLFSFIVTLESDLVLSVASATASTHQSHDYIPGNNFRGLLAGRLYRTLESADAWTLFHSGGLRFGDALPLSGGEVAWPMPLAWHHYKGASYMDGHGQLIAEAIFDPSRHEIEPGRQPVQMRGGYVTLSGRCVRPVTGQRSKTAINPQDGRAAESQLFSYHHLSAGQQFVLTISAEESIPDALLEQVCDTLVGHGRLGRSRSAQYGHVTISPTAPVQWPETRPADDGLFRLWLLSDLLQTDAGGNPCLIPAPDRLGLPEGSRWCQEKSHLRTRRLSRYNAYLKGWEPEMAVISRGSVLAFEVPQRPAGWSGPVHWLGSAQVGGLGLAALNPAILCTSQPFFTPMSQPSAMPAASPVAAEKATVLMAVLRRRAGLSDAGERCDKLASTLLDEMIEWLNEARRWSGVRNFEPIQGPGRSQWGVVRALASQHRHDDDAFWNQLFTGPHAAIRERRGQLGWSLALGPKERFMDRLRGRLEEIRRQNGVALTDLCGRLAKLALTTHWENALKGYNPLAPKPKGENES